MKRILQEEILDHLPEDAPEALHSRRDLKWINRMMGNYRWFRKVFAQWDMSKHSCLEIGSGDGVLGMYLYRHVKDAFKCTGLDLNSRPTQWPEAWGWYQGDVFGYTSWDQHSVFMGNMIFHHFDDEALGQLGERLNQHAQIILASEPARRRIHQIQARALCLAGVNHVTRHDAHVSIAAGFMGEDLPEALALCRDVWDVQCFNTPFGAYRMIAVRQN